MAGVAGRGVGALSDAVPESPGGGDSGKHLERISTTPVTSVATAAAVSPALSLSFSFFLLLSVSRSHSLALCAGLATQFILHKALRLLREGELTFCKVVINDLGHVGRHRCSGLAREEREFSLNPLVRIHFIIGLIWWTGLAPWEFEFPFPGSLIYIFLVSPGNTLG